MLFYIVLSAFVNMRIKSDSVVVLLIKSFRQSSHNSVYCLILLLFNLCSFSNRNTLNFDIVMFVK